MTDRELGWVAGIIDGEGSVGYHPVRVNGRLKMYYTDVRVANSDRGMIDKLQRLLGPGYIELRQPEKPHHKPVWRVKWISTKAVEILRLVVGELETKREQAEAVIQLYGAEQAVPQERPGVRRPEWLWALRKATFDLVRELNRRGKEEVIAA